MAVFYSIYMYWGAHCINGLGYGTSSTNEELNKCKPIYIVDKGIILPTRSTKSSEDGRFTAWNSKHLSINCIYNLGKSARGSWTPKSFGTTNCNPLSVWEERAWIGVPCLSLYLALTYFSRWIPVNSLEMSEQQQLRVKALVTNLEENTSITIHVWCTRYNLDRIVVYLRGLVV